MSTRPKRSSAAAQIAPGPVDQPAANKKVKTETSKQQQQRQGEINADTKSAALHNFLTANEPVFTPLLGNSNYITSHRVANPQVKPYELLAEQPASIKATLKPYQMIGISFLIWLHENGANGILGDEMGLGKTLTTLTLFAWLQQVKGVSGPHLVVCPLSVLSSWMTEIEKWLPSFKALRFHGQANERNRLLEKMHQEKPDIVIATYESYKAEERRFKHSGNWQYLVLDEGHKVKNHKSAVSLSLQNISAKQRLLLTGTPLQNNLAELWSLLRWLYPMVFTPTTEAKFHQAFDLVHGTYDQQFMKSCQKLLELIMVSLASSHMSQFKT